MPKQKKTQRSTDGRRTFLGRRNVRVIGSVYPGPSPKQDLRYAQVVADNIQKRKQRKKTEEEATA